MYYFDNNATTPLDERVLEVMLPYLSTAHGNASSAHRYGRKARAAIDTAREQVAMLVNAYPAQVIFTSGGTEANNFAIKSSAAQAGHLLVGATEHASVLNAAKSLEKQGWRIDTIPVDNNGLVQFQDNLLQQDTRFISVMLANNETGVISPIKNIVETARQREIIFHTDASQAAGKIPVDFDAIGANLMTLSAHKFYGPQGIGALITDKTKVLEPLLHGGGQEKGLRSGTENIAAIVGFGKAAEIAHDEINNRVIHYQGLKQQLEAYLSSLEGIEIVAESVERLPNTTMVVVDDIKGETLLLGLDHEDIAVSSGSACYAGKTEPSHVLVAMGYSNDQAHNAVRFSLGKEQTAADVHQLFAAIKKQLDKMRSLALAVAI
ncbi:cysteine desulfurase family protein [Candidatus Albibeggiatoa sp. nov. NOAA]|uniref:cysteine desulfurase family protein n=1 Tax=Candidatus Albibeggiatoa sp. nov. NOAA TaxID=3162724 RepID=UPI0033015D15|nr:cysteine desulfurase [Thiotrichaceae bacterium]